MTSSRVSRLTNLLMIGFGSLVAFRGGTRHFFFSELFSSWRDLALEFEFRVIISCQYFFPKAEFTKAPAFARYQNNRVSTHDWSDHDVTRRCNDVTLGEKYSKSPLGGELKPAILFCLDHTHYSLLGDWIMLNYSEIVNQLNCLKYQDKWESIY